MCEHCGCRGVQPIAELMDEHLALLDGAHRVRQALGAGDRHLALAELRVLVDRLARHVGREENGIFAALRAQGEFLDEVEQLEGEHRGLDAAIEGLDPDDPDLERRLARLFAELEVHVERENLGIFPVSVVTLGVDGWAAIDRAHAEIPTFLGEPDHAPLT
jgi:hemerythrin HHE cation binding domain-containing protein